MGEWYTSREFANGAVYKIGAGHLWVVDVDGEPRLPCDITYPLTASVRAAIVPHRTLKEARAAAKTA